MRLLSNKGMVYVFDIILILAILMNLFCVFTTQYFIGLEHNQLTGQSVRIIEINPDMREVLNNEETFEELSEEEKESINDKWKLHKMLAISYIIIIIPYLIIRIRVAKEGYKDGLYLYLLMFLSGGIFFMNLINFANDLGYLIGRMLG